MVDSNHDLIKGENLLPLISLSRRLLVCKTLWCMDLSNLEVYVRRIILALLPAVSLIPQHTY